MFVLLSRNLRDLFHQLAGLRQISQTTEYLIDSFPVPVCHNIRISKSISDQGWGMFQTMLKYKAEKFGHTYQEIGRFFPSSQLCSETLLPIPILQRGYDSLGVRFVDCPHCQKQHDKDVNAAINIRNVREAFPKGRFATFGVRD